jgi:hypothetical protein
LSHAKPLVSIPVGVVVERRKAKSQWVDYTWCPVAVLAGVPDTKPWTPLSEEKECTTFYVGSAEVALYPSETTQYRDNLVSGSPSLWVVLRPTGAEPPYEIQTVTADPAEGEGMTATGTDLVDAVPMPDEIAGTIEAFVSQHHVERVFFKRKRERADPEALGRRGPLREGEK